MRYLLTILLFSSLFISSACTRQDAEEIKTETIKNCFTLHSCLQSDMVLQRESDFMLWGTAEAGVTVYAEPSWNSECYKGQAGVDGIWEIIIPVPSAIKGNPVQSIEVYSEGDRTILENLLIGDVWVLGGQSNMGMKLSDSRNAAAEITEADQPFMRYFHIRQNEVREPLFDWSDVSKGHDWIQVSPSNAGDVSAVGYYFAKMLIQETDIPIGMINTSTGGSAIKSYIPEEVFEADQVLVENFKKSEPGRLYNSMVYPVERFSCKGFLWYQGESDWMRCAHYAHAQITLMETWREKFNCPVDAPFYYVQLAPYGNGMNYRHNDIFYASGDLQNYALMREAQGSIRSLAVNTAMAVTMDVGDLDDIHPKRKAPVGERLARIALNRDYGMSDMEYLGPVYKSKRLEDGVLKLEFENAEGLKTSNGKTPAHFYVSLEDARYYKASTSIHGEEVWLTSDQISSATSAEQLEVRYAFLFAAETNLENGLGLPAEPFRTDSWTKIRYNY